jgi:FkbM family methyltransferase
MNIDTLPSVTIGKYQWWSTNRKELYGIKQEIFQQNIYDTELAADSPVIIDAGAHVGLAALYFKLQYPKAHITCIEPHPDLVNILKHNLWFNRISDIDVIEAALSDKAGTTTLHVDDTPDLWLSTSGREGAWDQHQTTQSITVPAITLDSLLAHRVDLVKMDIEGAEEQVLSASHKLHHIDHLILELHPPTAPAQIQKIFKNSHTLKVEKHHYGLQLCYLSKH